MSLLTAALFAGVALAVPQVKGQDPGTAKLEDLEYSDAGGETLKLDVGVPNGEGPFPIAIVVHGGGWTGGDKRGDIMPVLAALTRANIAWFSINYRLAPQHRWPAPLEDVLAAIRWVKSHGAKFTGDPTRIALIGYSAGGQLATMAAATLDDGVRVQAVVGLAPLTDFVQELPKRGSILGRAQTGLLDRPQELTPESIGMLAAISPINHVRPGLPPFLILHGDKDASVPYEQSTAFQTRLQADGVRCDLITLRGAPHALALWEKSMPDYDERMIAWLREVMRPQR